MSLSSSVVERKLFILSSFYKEISVSQEEEKAPLAHWLSQRLMLIRKCFPVCKNKIILFGEKKKKVYVHLK